MLSAGSKVHLHMSCYVFEFMDFCFVGVTFFGHLFNGRAVKKDREMGKRHSKGPRVRSRAHPGQVTSLLQVFFMYLVSSSWLYLGLVLLLVIVFSSSCVTSPVLFICASVFPCSVITAHFLFDFDRYLLPVPCF